MEKVVIADGFEQMHEIYKKRYSNQRLFRSVKFKDGKEPVFYIGVPGLYIALAMSLVTIVTVYLLYQPFKWYIWAPYLVAVFFLFRISVKMDKVRQVRFMLWTLFSAARTSIENANEAAGEDRKSHLSKAKELLEKARQWADEPAISEQIAEIEKVI